MPCHHSQSILELPPRPRQKILSKRVGHSLEPSIFDPPQELPCACTLSPAGLGHVRQHRRVQALRYMAEREGCSRQNRWKGGSIMGLGSSQSLSSSAEPPRPSRAHQRGVRAPEKIGERGGVVQGYSRSIPGLSVQSLVVVVVVMMMIRVKEEVHLSSHG